MSDNALQFCDTNIFVYAFDLSAGEKRTVARQLIERLWDEGNGVISIQVLQELFVTLTRKVAPPLSSGTARSVVNDLSTWKVVEPTKHDVLEAIDASQRWGVSFWDAMILIAAQKAGAAVLWSEDLNDGQVYEEINVRNPFRR